MGMFKIGLDSIRTSENNYMKNMLFKPKEDVFTGYTRQKFPFGWIRDYHNPEIDKKRVYYLDLGEAFRMLYLASTRSGKTFYMRAMADRLVKSGFCVVFITDTKNEMWTSVDSVQSKFNSNMILGEKPEGMNLKVFRPTFFQVLEGNASKLPPQQEWCSMDLSRLQPRDFVTLLDFLGLTQRQIDGLERALFEAKKDGRKIRVWEDFVELIESAEYIDNQSSILNKLYKINYYNPFDPNHIVKPSDYIQDGYNLILNLQYFDSLEAKNGFLQVMIASWLRDLTDARKIKKIPPVVILLDEMPRFVPAQGDTVVKHEILELTDLATAYDINIVGASQDIVSIPERYVKQSKFVMVPWNADYNIVKDAMKGAGIADVEVKAQQYNEIRRMMSTMKARDWMVIDKNTKSYKFITSLSPLSRVLETGE